MYFYSENYIARFSFSNGDTNFLSIIITIISPIKMKTYKFSNINNFNFLDLK